MLILLVISIVERVLLGLFLLWVVQLYWASNLQKIFTLSTTEAEYIVAIETRKEMIWLHSFLDELGRKQEMGILYSDS